VVVHGSDEALRYLARAGARIDWKDRGVRLPGDVVEDALRVAPSRVSLTDRRGNALELGGTGHHHCPVVNCLQVLDPTSLKLRPCRRQDVVDLTRLADYLPRFAAVHPIDMACEELSTEGGEAGRARQVLACVFTNTAKHLAAYPVNREWADTWIQMGELLCKDGDLSHDPIISLWTSSLSPLQLVPEAVYVILTGARKGIPMVFVPHGMAGGTTPFTMAGTLTLMNAEFLFMLSLAYAVRPGTPVVYGPIHNIMNLKTGSMPVGTPEANLGIIAQAQLGRYYHMPVYLSVAETSSADIDVQCGAEKWLSLCLAWACGAHISMGAGTLANASAVSYQQMVIDHDLFEAAERWCQGIAVNEETLALEAIARVGATGDYMSDAHTLRWMRTGEHYYGGCFNRQGRQGRNMLHRAGDIVRQVLNSHQPAVPAGTVERIQEYVSRLS
jgi:trimethylamine--corrinoid protein Co-methyltransferase